MRVAIGVAAFVAALGGIGAVSRATSNTEAAKSVVPAASWYWTMAVSPSNPDELVLATGNGLYRSTDGGKSWHASGLSGVDATSVVAGAKAFFAGGVRTAPAAPPLVQSGAGRSAPDGPTVLATSTDGGKTWRELRARGLPNMALQSLAVDPANANVLYALLNDGALYRSADGARSFELLSSKVGFPSWALAVARGEFLGGDMDTGPHVSANGKSWQATPFTDAQGTHMVMEYAAQPTDLSRVLMTSYGVELSTDGGKSWRPALASKVMFGPVAFAPGASKVAYAVGFDRSLWRSDDDGATWSRVP
jgi:photosystem II stability/assembly factor-like uncharacterized protein